MSDIRDLTDEEWLIRAPESGPIIVQTLAFVRQWPRWKRIVFWRRYRRAFEEYQDRLLQSMEDQP